MPLKCLWMSDGPLSFNTYMLMNQCSPLFDSITRYSVVIMTSSSGVKLCDNVVSNHNVMIHEIARQSSEYFYRYRYIILYFYFFICL